MRKTVIVLAVSLLGAASVAASPENEVMAPVREFIDAFNKGDVKRLQATCADQTFIIDDFPPNQWRGSRATSKWFHDLTESAKKNGMSEAFVSLQKPRRVGITGSSAYVIVPVKLTYKDKSRLVNTAGLMTLALHKGADGWRIGAWAWTWGNN